MKEQYISDTNQQIDKQKQLDDGIIHRTIPPNLVRINADNESKRCQFMLWFIFLSWIALISILAATILPSAIIALDRQEQLDGTNLSGCKQSLVLNNNTVECIDPNQTTSIGHFAQHLKPLNQFMFFYLYVPKNYSSFNNEKIKLIIYESRISTSTKVTVGNPNSTTTYNNAIVVEKKVNNFPYTYSSGDGNYNEKESRYEFWMATATKLDEQDKYYWQLQFNENTTDFDNIGDLQLQNKVVNPQFSIFTILVRVAFFIASGVMSIIYNWKIVNMPVGLVIIEQKAIRVLSGLTLAFNDLFYFINILYPNSFSTFMSSFFITNFVISLIIIWVFFLRRIAEQEGQMQTNILFTPGFIANGVCLYLILLITSSVYAMFQTDNHPIFSARDLNLPGVWVMFLFAFLIIGGNFIFILYMYIKIFSNGPNKMWRSTLFMIFTVIFIVALVILLVIGALNTFSYSAAKIFMAFALLNFYSIYLQYMFLPASQQIDQINDEFQIKKQIFEQQLKFDEEPEIQIEQIEEYDFFRDEMMSNKKQNQSQSEGNSSGSSRRKRRNRHKKPKEKDEISLDE